MEPVKNDFQYAMNDSAGKDEKYFYAAVRDKKKYRKYRISNETPKPFGGGGTFKC